MKVGDTVRSTKVRPGDRAKVIKADIKVRNDNKKQRKEIRTSYTAQFPDKSTFIFYGFDIDRTVFKVEEANGQMRLEDFMDMEV